MEIYYFEKFMMYVESVIFWRRFNCKGFIWDKHESDIGLEKVQMLSENIPRNGGN
jgi:hypothetical protein